MERKDFSVVFMGTPDFAVASLNSLYQSGYQVKAVVTVPDKPAGRGLKLKESAVKKYAVANQLPVLQPSKLKDPEFLQQLRDINPDIIVVVAFRMLPREVWSMAKLGTFNLHGSLLPRYRGAAPINWAVINGDKETGVTTFLLDDKIDTGEILLREKIAIGDDDSAGDVHDKLMDTGARLVVETCDLLASGNARPVNQSEITDVTEKPAPKIFREDCLIDWNQQGISVFNKIRGLSPYPGAFTRLKSGDEEVGELKIFSSRLHPGKVNEAPGKVVQMENGPIRIATTDGYIEPLEVQLSGKKRMKMEELNRGWRVRSETLTCY